MKIYVRNRSRSPNSWFPYQAVLWFKPEGKESWRDTFLNAVGFSAYLRHELKWSSGALGRIPGIVDTRHRGGDSIGILFNHRDFAEEAKTIYKRTWGVKEPQSELCKNK